MFVLFIVELYVMSRYVNFFISSQNGSYAVMYKWGLTAFVESRHHYISNKNQEGRP